MDYKCLSCSKRFSCKRRSPHLLFNTTDKKKRVSIVFIEMKMPFTEIECPLEAAGVRFSYFYNEISVLYCQETASMCKCDLMSAEAAGCFFFF